MANSRTYNTLDDIQQRKDELKEAIHKNNQQISTRWYGLFTPQKADSKGEMVTNIISNCITAFDAFMLARKLMNRYGSFFFRKEKKERHEKERRKRRFLFG